MGLALSMSACSMTDGLLGRGSDETGASDGRAVPAPDEIDAQGLAVYLEMMQRLIKGDALTQAETYREVEEAADFAPTTTNRLRHALALSVPGHVGSDSARAEQRLSALLAAGDALLPEERVIATIQLRDVEQRLVLEATAERLRDELESSLAEQNAEATRRIESLLEENRRLQAELEDATQKLDAITSIEQSIREREDASN